LHSATVKQLGGHQSALEVLLAADSPPAPGITPLSLYCLMYPAHSGESRQYQVTEVTGPPRLTLTKIN